MKQLILYLFIISFLGAESLDTLDMLLSRTKNSSLIQSAHDKAKLDNFLLENKRQKAMLLKIKSEYKKEVSISKKLKNEIDKREKNLALLEQKLKLRVGNLGEMFGVIRQVGGDLRANIDSSPTSTILKGRSEFLTTMLESKELPNIQKLESLWYLLQEEITYSRKVITQKQSIITKDGTIKDVDVTSIGLFNAIYGDKFLRYSSQTKSYVELPSQPSSRLRAIAENFVNKDGINRVVIDPTRGEILAMLTQKPTILQRVDQGGVVGYIILTLGVIGLFISIARFIVLNNISRLVEFQLNNLDDIKDDNPLGRVMSIFKRYKDIDLDSFEAKIEEAILKELPPLKSYESLIKLIATVAPLLGLLGTVTGMIETFGAITLFGTGDPKLMAGGISQALMTTVLGLVVAIPMLFLYTFISSRSNKIVSILDEQSAGLIVKKIQS